jgi:Rrf2 family protein
MKLLSDASEYGLRAVVWLAQHPGQAQKVREIAQGTRAAPGYLVKVLQELTKARILSAQRGSSGGFRLERDPAELSVLEVVTAIDPIERIRTCPLGLALHGECLCPMHRRIDDAMAAIERSFDESTIKDLLIEPTKSHLLCDALSSEST